MTTRFRHNHARLGAILIALLIIVPCVSAVAQPTLSVSMAEGFTGESALLSIDFAGGAEPYAGVRVRILLPGGVSAGEIIAGPVLDAFTVASSVQATGMGDELTLLAYSIDTSFESPDASELFAVMLNIAEDVAPGTAPLVILEAATDVSNADGSAQVALALENGALNIFAAGDSDGDMLDDAWELEHFGTLDMGPDDDADNDGRTNAEELADGTDPNDANDPAAVPNLVGLNEGDARTAVETAGFLVGTVATEASVSVPAGRVIQQSTLAGSLLPLGAIIAFTVSTGPGNDDFANRVDLGNVESVDTTGINFDATAEANEPGHAWAVASASVWWSWTAPEPLPGSMPVVLIQTHGSDFNTRAAVYIGDTVDALELVASGDDNDGLPTSSVGFRPTAGMRYAIAVDGVLGDEGNVVLSLSVHSGAFVSGVVKTPAEEPIANASVTAVGPMHAQTIADGNGRYELGPLAPGFYTLDAVTPTGEHGANAINLAASAMIPRDIVVDQIGRLTAPANVDASDGEFADRVVVGWDQVPGAVTYEVWRSSTDLIEEAVLVATTQETNFNDTDGSKTVVAAIQAGPIEGNLAGWLLLASALTGLTGGVVRYHNVLIKRHLRQAIATAALLAILLGAKCAPDPFEPEVKHYWVRTVDEAGPSAYSDSDSGFRDGQGTSE